MNPALTQFGAQMSHLTGVRAIMKDIIETLRAGSGQEFINLSAGNPVILPEVEQLWRDCTAELLASPEYGEVVCRYGSSQGYQPLINAVLADFNQRYGLNLTDRNILITPGSQSIYFYAANAFGGYTAPPPSPPYQGGARGGSDWSQKVAVILGNGGAARAVVAGCAQLGCAEIHVVGRSEQNLGEFQQSWVNSPMPVQNLQVHTWDNLSMLISQADLLVNTTPVGMYPQGEKSPVASGAIDRISAGAIVYDLIYNPNPTQFLKDAQLRGARAIDGLPMLVQQGAAALKIWLDRESVPVDVMRQALLQHLGLD